jgi:hypothetical protein
MTSPQKSAVTWQNIGGSMKNSPSFAHLCIFYSTYLTWPCFEVHVKQAIFFNHILSAHTQWRRWRNLAFFEILWCEASFGSPGTSPILGNAPKRVSHVYGRHFTRIRRIPWATPNSCAKALLPLLGRSNSTIATKCLITFQDSWKTTFPW